MNFTESDHIRQLRDTLERFVEKEMPRSAAAEWDKKNYFPRDVFDKLANLGVLGLTVPEEYGGAGRDILATMVVIEELSRRSLAVSVPYIMGACYAGMNLVECATEAQKRELLPKVVDGSLIFAYGWTEPDAGADLASVKARRPADCDRPGDGHGAVIGRQDHGQTQRHELLPERCRHPFESPFHQPAQLPADAPGGVGYDC